MFGLRCLIPLYTGVNRFCICILMRLEINMYVIKIFICDKNNEAQLKTFKRLYVQPGSLKTLNTEQ